MVLAALVSSPFGYINVWRSMSSTQLDHTFRALSDPTRRAILARLTRGDVSVTTLTAQSSLSQPAISKHLRVLEDAGLVSRHREAQRRLCRLEPGPLREASRWLSSYREFWTQSFENLDALLDEVRETEVDDER